MADENIKVSELPEQEQKELLAEAYGLGIKGVLVNCKVSTVKGKIAEKKAELEGEGEKPEEETDEQNAETDEQNGENDVEHHAGGDENAEGPLVPAVLVKDHGQHLAKCAKSNGKEE